jgi:hypothetical protein
MEQKWTIEKLNANNYATWKFQMEHYLKAHNYWIHVSQPLAADANEATRETRAKAFSNIVLSIEPSQLYLITTFDDPRDAWRALKGHYDRQTVANKLFLKRSFFRAEMDEGSTVEQHLKKMKELTDKLSAVGAEVSEEDQVVTLLGSLPSSYATIVTALEARIDELTLNFVQHALINESQKREESAVI